MPDENGTATTHPDAPSADDTPVTDTAEKADDAPAAVVEDEEVGEKAEKETQGSDDADARADASEELKVVVSIKGGRAVIGVQQPSSDPHIETFEDHDLPALAQEIPALTERARARWEDNPKHPAYERPAPPAKRRNRRQQGTAQDANAEGAAEQEQQQTLRLF